MNHRRRDFTFNPKVLMAQMMRLCHGVMAAHCASQGLQFPHINAHDFDRDTLMRRIDVAITNQCVDGLVLWSKCKEGMIPFTPTNWREMDPADKFYFNLVAAIVKLSTTVDNNPPKIEELPL